MGRLLAIDGKYSTDLEIWINFGADAVEDVIKSIPVVKGLVLTGQLSSTDCHSIIDKKQHLVILDLHRTHIPVSISTDDFTTGAPHLQKFVAPYNIIM